MLLGTMLSGTGRMALHSGTGAPGLGGRDLTGGKYQVSEDRPAASFSQDTAGPHCSPNRPGWSTEKWGKTRFKWRRNGEQKLKPAIVFFFLQTFFHLPLTNLSSKRPYQSLNITADSVVRM